MLSNNFPKKNNYKAINIKKINKLSILKKLKIKYKDN